MEKIIVTMANQDAIEVRENQRLVPRYGNGTGSSFPSLILKEQKVNRQCEKILSENLFPLVIRKLIDFGIFDKDDSRDAKLSDFFVVLQKANELLDQGFHVLIVTAIILQKLLGQ